MALPSPMDIGLAPAAGVLGMGDMVSRQTQQETEEEKRRKRLGISGSQNSPLMQSVAGVFGGAGRAY